MDKSKQETWIKPRHRIIRNIAYALVYPYCRIKYRVKIDKFQEQGSRPYLILLNHQTPFDQFFVGASFSGPVYYLATEDIFSLGWISSLIRWLVAPIPIKKQTMDIMAVKTCLRVAHEAGTIAIAPEGNRTYSGKTEYMNPSIASLAKKLKLPIALYRIEGGYGVQPRWSDVIRKGSMHAYVSRVIEPEEYEKLSKQELFSLIEQGLTVNEAVSDGVFHHKKRAEYMERMLYVCPYCGLSKFESHNEIVECQCCHRKIEYLPTKELSGVGFDFPFTFINDWYEYQKNYVRNLDLSQYADTPMFTDTARISEVILRKRKNPLRDQAKIALYGDRIEIDEDSDAPMTLSFDDISGIAVLGRNKLNVYHLDKVYQFKGDPRFNALKYVNLYHHYGNVKKGDSNGEFLGL